jgi:prostaglandin-endoperoxide synthase 2
MFGRGRMPMLDNTMREILRLHPPVSFIFGRATADRLIESDTGSYLVRQGELVMGVLPIAHRDPTRFPAPDRFEISRYDDESTSGLLIWPRGPHDATVTPQDRTCPGKDVGVLFAKLFCVALAKFDWRLKDRPEWDQHKFSLNVAAPKGLLEVESFRAASPQSSHGEGVATAA